LCTYVDQINNIIILVKGDISNMFSINEQQQLINIHTTSKSFESNLTIDDISLIKKELCVYKEK